jgi:hypothetical protein
MERYTIRVAGHLAARWAEWLDGLELRHEDDGTTLLYGMLPDQSALFGVLIKIRDLNLTLLTVKRLHDNAMSSEQSEA